MLVHKIVLLAEDAKSTALPCTFRMLSPSGADLWILHFHPQLMSAIRFDQPLVQPAFPCCWFECEDPNLRLNAWIYCNDRKAYRISECGAGVPCRRSIAVMSWREASREIGGGLSLDMKRHFRAWPKRRYAHAH